MRFRKKPPSALDSLPELGRIPTSKDSGIAAPPIGDRAAAYTDVATAVDGTTTGKVFLVTAAAPGHGATTTAINLAIAAARAGRRVLLIDSDEGGYGISRFLATGPVPGFTELALGTASLAEASRLVTIDERTVFPIIPLGHPHENATILASVAAADAIESVAETADIVLIDAPPVSWSDATAHLGAHADGSILVTTDGAEPSTVSKAVTQLADVGAPVVGYVTNRT